MENVCPKCCKQNKETANFCTYCGTKMNDICPKCWMKNKQPYNCGFDKCPGYRLPVLEKLQS